MADGSGIVEEAPAALRRATVADAGHVLDALTAAFLDDAVIGWLLPTAATRPVRLRRFFAIELHRLAHLGVLRIGGCPPMWPMLRAPR